MLNENTPPIYAPSIPNKIFQTVFPLNIRASPNANNNIKYKKDKLSGNIPGNFRYPIK